MVSVLDAALATPAGAAGRPGPAATVVAAEAGVAWSRGVRIHHQPPPPKIRATTAKEQANRTPSPGLPSKGVFLASSGWAPDNTALWSVICSMAAALPSAPQTGQDTRDGIRPSSGSISNAYFCPQLHSILIGIINPFHWWSRDHRICLFQFLHYRVGIGFGRLELFEPRYWPIYSPFERPGLARRPGTARGERGTLTVTFRLETLPAASRHSTVIV